MRYSFTGKTVILTGASSGIGRSLALRLIRDYDCTVIAIARNEQRLYKVRDELDSLSAKYIPHPFDVSKKESWQNLALELEKSSTYPDILINCAGVLPKFHSGQSSDEIQRIFDINFFSQVYSAEAMLPLLKANGCGAIINISSSSALCPFAGVSAYCASKSASERYTAALSCESELFVACVMPGFTKTDIMVNQGASDKDARLFNKISSDTEKVVSTMLRRLKRGQRRIIIGADAHMMNLLFKFFPRSAPRLITSFLKKTGLEIFREI